MEITWDAIEDIQNKLSRLKSVLPEALLTWDRTEGKESTTDFLHAANPEVIALLFNALEEEKAISEMWKKNCHLEQALKLAAQSQQRSAVTMIVPASLSGKDVELYVRQLTDRDEEISALKAKLEKAEQKQSTNCNLDGHQQ